MAWETTATGGLGFGTTEDYTMHTAPELGNLTFDGALTLDVKVGAYHACVRTQNQQFRCWGVDDKGQLGLGITATVGDLDRSPLSRRSTWEATPLATRTTPP